MTVGTSGVAMAVVTGGRGPKQGGVMALYRGASQSCKEVKSQTLGGSHTERGPPLAWPPDAPPVCSSPKLAPTSTPVLSLAEEALFPSLFPEHPLPPSRAALSF